MDSLRKLRKLELGKLAEVVDRSKWLSKTLSGKVQDAAYLKNIEERMLTSKLKENDLKLALKSGLLTYLLHCEARVASFLGRGFYTIGPCGEELVGLTSLHLKEKDLAALHYRHVANSVTRQLMAGVPTSAIALSRARGFACSIHDPVTGGRHCSIGGNHGNEFIVTSTLSSQCPPALGRALAIPYASQLISKDSKFASDAISYVSIGDGSVSNAHFLSALNLARHTIHNKTKCPLLFVITDNNISISLKNNGYVESFVRNLGGIHREIVDGQDFLDIYIKSGVLIDYVRTFKRPAVLYIKNIPRRFGHAATDRQFAYYSAEEIAAQVSSDPLSEAFKVLHSLGVYKEEEVTTLFHELEKEVKQAFDIAVDEPKIHNRNALIASNASPVYITPGEQEPRHLTRSAAAESSKQPKEVMRKHMTRIYDEILNNNKEAVYIGEDVRHGGYYLVTEGLAAKYPTRVLDFPPDETSLLGIGVGFAQAGLLPIVEIPYAKYLDCGMDMFYEAIIAHWLSNGQQPNGMVIRLQGFDRGIFGGNFHTHNMLNIMAPGLDVVCFSNGYDYARGMRFVVDQIKRSKRIVAVVDSTDLLNRRHLKDNKKDERMLYSFPNEQSERYDFDQIIVYPPTGSKVQGSGKRKQIVIVTYGNGVPTSMIAQQALCDTYHDFLHDVVVIDVPCISQTPGQLTRYVQENYEHIEMIVFADVCKSLPGMPLAKMAVDLQNQGLLTSYHMSQGDNVTDSSAVPRDTWHSIKWKAIGASPTYNPLGSYITFLSVEDVLASVKSMM